jgi:hypothetical protein
MNCGLILTIVGEFMRSASINESKKGSSDAISEELNSGQLSIETIRTELAPLYDYINTWSLRTKSHKNAAKKTCEQLTNGTRKTFAQISEIIRNNLSEYKSELIHQRKPLKENGRYSEAIRKCQANFLKYASRGVRAPRPVMFSEQCVDSARMMPGRNPRQRPDSKPKRQENLSIMERLPLHLKKHIFTFLNDQKQSFKYSNKEYSPEKRPSFFANAMIFSEYNVFNNVVRVANDGTTEQMKLLLETLKQRNQLHILESSIGGRTFFETLAIAILAKHSAAKPHSILHTHVKDTLTAILYECKDIPPLSRKSDEFICLNEFKQHTVATSQAFDAMVDPRGFLRRKAENDESADWARSHPPVSAPEPQYYGGHVPYDGDGTWTMSLS